MSRLPPTPPRIRYQVAFDKFWKRLHHPVPGLAGWNPMVSAAFLGVGTVLLLLGPVLWLAYGTLSAFWLGAVALIPLAVGSLKLGLDIAEVRRDPGQTPELRRRLMWVFYGGSWLGLLVGATTLQGRGWSLGLPPLLAGILPELFPYVPTVFAPVVIGHAAIFLLGTNRLQRWDSVNLSLLGIGALFIISFAGLGLQFGRQLGELGLLLAGITCIGYLVTVAAWRWQPRERPSQVR